MGEHAKALADLDEAIRLKPDNWCAYADRARIYGKLGDYAKQIADLKEEIRLKPDYDTNYISPGTSV